jgi:outer membrane protein OmpA-like peptidoglycan-associated protein/nucleotide-binding universal stress UspA family protein
MKLYDILVHVDQSPRAQMRLDIAGELARRHAAHLTALQVIDVALPVMAMGDGGGGAVIAELMEQKHQSALAAGVKLKAAFEAALAREGIMGANLLVMGAYVHSRLREFILGGVTRRPLRKMTVRQRKCSMVPMRLASVALAMVSLLGSASAQQINGFYVGGGAGATITGPTKTPLAPNSDSTLSSPRHDLVRKWELGGIGVLSLGYGFGNGFRAEIEGQLQYNEASSAIAFHRTVPINGNIMGYGVMGNILYDIDLRSIGINTTAVVPYVGLGLGYMLWSFNDVSATVGDSRQFIDDQNGVLGYQAIVGASFPITSVPGLSLTAEYRFYNEFGDPELKANVTTTTTGTTRSETIKIGNYGHSGLIGLRYSFGAAPVVAAAPAPIASARTFLVFFDWSKADLTDRARQIIGEAASARGTGVTRIEVNGFTDRSGPADYNMQLSQRRANAVAAELVRRGVPRNEIVTRGFGEENNLVPTADGVREPQNRRVEIILK